MKSKQSIDCAAIRADDGTVYSLPRPNRHHHVIRDMRAKGYVGPVGGDRQGFLLSDGMFVRRKPALGVAIKAGQVERTQCHAAGIGLFSEDLW